eukprot:55123-Prorocentrum_minimum.AAC.2
MAEDRAYNPALDTTSRGAIHKQAYEQVKQDGELGGGSTSQCGATGGYDALECRPDGSLIRTEPGYEKPASGPTTNFVGNHMTQVTVVSNYMYHCEEDVGAIDLVQSELTRPDPLAEIRQMRLDMARGIYREPPALISKETREDNDRTIPSPQIQLAFQHVSTCFRPARCMARTLAGGDFITEDAAD